MKSNLRRGLSIRARTTLFTLGIFLIGIWSLSFYVEYILHGDMRQLLGEQQLSTVAFVANGVSDELTDRMDALKSIADGIDATLLAQPAALQKYLEQRPILQILFNGGVLIVGSDGRAIADVPLAAGRIGVDYSNVDSIIAALAEGKSTVGRPVIGRTLHVPLFGMAAPIRDRRHRVIGALLGVTNLGKPNFLDKITTNRYGQSGGYLLLAPQHRLIVTATDKNLVMKETSAVGIAAELDRLPANDENHFILTDANGVETLSSFKKIPIAGWIAVATQPSAEVFAPIRNLQRHMLLATIVLTALAGCLTWWMLRRQLSPIFDVIRTLTARSATNQPPPPLPIDRDDEIGQLIGSFNRLLHSLQQREEALKASEAQLHATVAELSRTENELQRFFTLIPDPLCIASSDGYFLKINPAWQTVLGYSETELRSKPFLDFVHPDDRAATLSAVAHQAAGHVVRCFVNRYRCRDGAYKWLEWQSIPELETSRLFASARDITERKQAEEQLQLAASVFSHAREGIMITDANGVVIDVNAAFTRITSYSRDEVLGRNPRLLKFDHQGPEFYAVLWKELTENGYWRGEIWNRRKNGEVYAEMLTIDAVRDGDGRTKHYVALFSDITALKQHEQQLERIAHYDALTSLPNRLLLADRLQQAMAQAQRRQRKIVVAFLDLDGFKAINDSYGHAAGDHVLIVLTSRLKLALREGDTIARLGGDEFVVILLDLDDIEAGKPTLTRLLTEASRPVQTGYRLLQVSASVGVTFYPQANDVDGQQLLCQADRAMYRAKLSGKNRYCVYDELLEHVKRLSTIASQDSDDAL